MNIENTLFIPFILAILVIAIQNIVTIKQRKKIMALNQLQVLNKQAIQAADCLISLLLNKETVALQKCFIPLKDCEYIISIHNKKTKLQKEVDINLPKEATKEYIYNTVKEILYKEKLHGLYPCINNIISTKGLDSKTYRIYIKEK